MRVLLRPLLVALCAAFVAPSAQCTIIIRQDLADLVRQSLAVVRGTVRGGVADWDADRRFIWTTTTLDVAECWKGGVTGALSLRELGGETGGLGMKVAGAPQYAKGEDVLVFLTKDAQGFWRTLGWTQGKFLLGADAARPGRGLATNAHDHVVAPYFRGEDLRAPNAVEYRAFKARVEAMIAALPKPPAGGGK
jgi:hypothetical protein